MRNILQYPLNSNDIIATLENAHKIHEEKGSYGSMDGQVYSQLLKFLKDENNMKLVLDYKVINE